MTDRRRRPGGSDRGDVQEKPESLATQPTAAPATPLCPGCAARARFEAAVAGPSDLMKRRYPPTGDKELWVRFGTDGPPEGWSEGWSA